MSNILLWVNKENETRARVYGEHSQPFDPNNGFGKTLEELEAEGALFVDNILPPENKGKMPVHYINPQTKEQWYEYEEFPKTEIEVLREENEILKRSQADQDEIIMNLVLGGM